MATHSSTFAWKIPWTEEPGRLQSTGSQQLSNLHSLTLTHLHTHTNKYPHIHTFTCRVTHTHVSYTFIYRHIFIYYHLFGCTGSQSHGAHGSFSCGMWDPVPRLGIKPRPLALGAQSLRHRASREVPVYIHMYVHIYAHFWSHCFVLFVYSFASTSLY